MMRRRLPLLISLIICMGVVVLTWGNSARAGLRNPGLSEDEIKRGWTTFSQIQDVVQVRGRYPYRPYFEVAARRYNLPLCLLIAMARGESDFDPRAISHKGCLGIMQIKWPGTAKDLGIHKKKDLFDPVINIDAGARYFAWLLARFGGDYYLAVAAYNYGPNAVTPKKVPEGAKWYAAYILRHLVHVIERRASGGYDEGWATARSGTDTIKKDNAVLILGFDTYQAATGFAGYLQREVRGIPLEISGNHRYAYGVYLTFKSLQEREQYLKRLINKTGIRPMG